MSLQCSATTTVACFCNSLKSNAASWRDFLRVFSGFKRMVILIFFISHWYLSLFSQTFFHHRYASHGAFTMSRVWERVFFIFSYITQGSTYMSPRTYGIMHRLHHAHTDTIRDPHSPAYSSNMISMMLRTSKIYMRILDGKWQVPQRFTKNLPEWHWLDELGNSRWSRTGWIVAYTVFCHIAVVIPSATCAFCNGRFSWCHCQLVCA